MFINFFNPKNFKLIKNSFFIKKIQKSGGNWAYPFILFSWFLAKIIVPRRKVKTNGVSFTLSCTNWITHFRWYLFKTKEPETIDFINNFISPGDVFFDIGANIGVFSIYASKKHKNIKTYCFEPEISNLATLKENIISNGLMDQTYIYSLGIGNTTGISRLHLQDLTPGAALHSEHKEDLEYSFEGKKPIIWTEGIYVVTLDYVCSELNIIPNVIKIDTDGNEGKILQGASKTLKSSSLNAIILEMPLEQEEYCVSLLSKSGFKRKIHSNKASRNQIWLKSI